MTKLIFLDTETTGLQPDRHTIWDIAWICAEITPDEMGGDMESLVLGGSFNSTVKITPAEHDRADPYGLKIGHFAQRYDHDSAISRDEAISNLWDACGGFGDDVTRPHLVGGVPSFDATMLYVNWLGFPGYGEGPFHYHLIDVETFAAAAAGMLPPYTGDAVGEAHGVTNKAPHTAWGDTVWAVEMFAQAAGLTIVSPNIDLDGVYPA